MHPLPRICEGNGLLGRWKCSLRRWGSRPRPGPTGLSAPYVIDPAALRALTLRRRPFVTVIVTKTPRNQPRVVRQIRTA
jgi:hypothetical protein